MSQPQEKSPKISQADFDFIRLKLISVSDKIHWVQSEEDLQKKISLCLTKMSIESLAEEISINQSILENFLLQKSEIELLHKEIAEAKDHHRDSRYINYSDQLREKIYKYFNFISVNRLAGIVGVPSQSWTTGKNAQIKKLALPMVRLQQLAKLQKAK